MIFLHTECRSATRVCACIRLAEQMWQNKYNNGKECIRKWNTFVATCTT